ncbi:hypothetical protein B0H14DRAFT_3141921 [Mycena olivaceomarginata]|nr:hypothetical protein B0H14DRAFT_3141921 [Mycena olivaceomarginata]
MRHPCTPRRLDPTADRDRRCQARQAPEETPGRIASRKRRSSASSTGSQGPQRKRVCTEGGCQGLGGEIRHHTAVARSVPSTKGDEKTQSLNSTSKENPPLPALFKFKQNPPVATALARLPIDPVSDLNEVFPPTMRNSCLRAHLSIPVGRARGQIVGDHGRLPQKAHFGATGHICFYPSAVDFGDHPALKHGVSTKFRTAVLAAAAVPVVSAHDLTGSYMVSWSELEQVCFEERKEIAQGVRMLRSFDEVGADLSALWYSISKTAGFG